ncbi:Rha family transcriptional regulator [Megalodesulfovibrio paquesii]
MSDLIPLDVTRDLEFHGDQPMVSSLRIAERFGKQHGHVLRDIREISVNCSESFSASNFGFTSYIDSFGRSLPMCLLTRDGFSMLVMGYTGPEAMRWKEGYIAAFNALEAAVKTSLVQRLRQAEAERQALEATHRERVAGLLALPDERRQLLLRVGRYAKMGLARWEITRLTGLHKDTIRKILRQAEALGLIDPQQEKEKPFGAQLAQALFSMEARA